MAFPDPRIELEIGSSLVDVTSVVVTEDGIRHSRGRRAEGSRVDPAEVALTLRDPNGDFNSRNPRSPYYGQIGRNTRLRYSVGGADVALVIPSGMAGRASTPDHSSLDITGDIDIRADLTAASWTGVREGFAWEVIGKLAAGQTSWRLIVQDDGTLSLLWSTNGSNALTNVSTQPVPFGPGERGAVRVTLDVNNGSGGRTTTYYTAPTLAGPWDQLGDPIVTSGTTSIHSGTAPLEVGELTTGTFGLVSRRVHAAEVRSGIGGTVVAAPVFTAQASGTTSFVDSAGRTWTVAGDAEITDRRYRCVGEISEWQPRWHVSGHDVRAPLRASGVLRRLGQGARPLASALTRGLPLTSPAPVAYWPLEDGQHTVYASSPIAGCQPLTVSGFDMASDSSFPASDALPVIGTASTMSGAVPGHTASDWMIAFYYKIDTAPASTSTILEWTTNGSPWRIWRLRIGTTVWQLLVEDGAGATTLVTSGNSADFVGEGWLQWVIRVLPNGADLDVLSSNSGFNTLTNTSGGRITGIRTTLGANLQGASIGHLAVWGSAGFTDDEIANAFTGEAAGTRVVRLGSDESLPVDVYGSITDQQAMGYQRPATLLELLRQCEDSDGGILVEDRERVGLVYRGRATLYNQDPVLILPYGHLAPPLEPSDDDQRIRNENVVRREGGSFGVVADEDSALSVFDPPAGVGLYSEETTLNLASDAQCEPIAGWLTHLGTIDEARYRTIKLYLHKHREYVDAATRIDVGSVIRITDLPAHLPPGPLDLMVEGLSEVIRPHYWELTLSCSPASAWLVGAVALARADTAGCVLASSVDADDTSLTVTTTSGPLWTTDPVETPWDVRMGGEVMTVTRVNGPVQDRFARTVTSGWGVADSGQTWTTTGGAASDYSVLGA